MSVAHSMIFHDKYLSWLHSDRLPISMRINNTPDLVDDAVHKAYGAAVEALTQDVCPQHSNEQFGANRGPAADDGLCANARNRVR
jgi:hypothetical protein